MVSGFQEFRPGFFFLSAGPPRSNCAAAVTALDELINSTAAREAMLFGLVDPGLRCSDWVALLPDRL
jgi:hypothetical protein